MPSHSPLIALRLKAAATAAFSKQNVARPPGNSWTRCAATGSSVRRSCARSKSSSASTSTAASSWTAPRCRIRPGLQDDGVIVVSEELDAEARVLLWFDRHLRVRSITDGQRAYLPWHRRHVFNVHMALHT